MDDRQLLDTCDICKFPIFVGQTPVEVTSGGGLFVFCRPCYATSTEHRFKVRTPVLQLAKN